MKILSTEHKDNHLIATIESDAISFDKNYKKYFQLEQKKVSVKGFRKGKVPLDLASKYINHNVVNEKTLNAVVYDTIELLKKSEQLHEFEVFDDVVKNEIIDFKSDTKVVIFKSYFETKPEVELGDYSSIETIFEPKNLEKIYWPVPTQCVGEKSVIYIRLSAHDSKKIRLVKYCFDLLEIDLEYTKINSDLIEQIKSVPINSSKTFELDVNDEKIVFLVEMLNSFDKKEIDQKLMNEISNQISGEISTPEALKELQKQHFENQNEEFAKNVVVQWSSSHLNKMSCIPTHNLTVESRKVFKNYMKSYGHQLANNEEVHQQIFENIFFDNLSKIKIACVLEKIIKQENITVEDQDVEKWTQTILSQPHMYPHIDLNSEYNKDNALVKSIAQQDKCIKLLKKNIVFSS